MGNPYLIHGPAILSISGGRTSGFMLRQIIDAHGGKLPADVVPVFCNTSDGVKCGKQEGDRIHSWQMTMGKPGATLGGLGGRVSQSK